MNSTGYDCADMTVVETFYRERLTLALATVDLNGLNIPNFDS